MTNKLVSLETAKLAKKLGFDEICSYGYNQVTDGLINMNNLNSEDILTSAPTQSLLQKWLRETHKIRVFVEQSVQGIFKYTIHKWNYDNSVGKWQRISHPNSYNTYEEALEAGLQEALKLIGK